MKCPKTSQDSIILCKILQLYESKQEPGDYLKQQKNLIWDKMTCKSKRKKVSARAIWTGPSANTKTHLK